MNKLCLMPILLVVLACSTDHVKEEKAIRSLLKQEQQAHLQKDVDLFVSEFADSMIGVNHGNVSIPSAEQHRHRIGQYFGSVDFVRWEDVAEPVIRFSDDASLAYAVIQKQVIITQKDDPSSKPDTTHYAWVSILRKRDGQWKVECNVSTEKVRR